MANDSNLTLALRITGDAREAVAATEAVRKSVADLVREQQQAMAAKAAAAQQSATANAADLTMARKVIESQRALRAEAVATAASQELAARAATERAATEAAAANKSVGAMASMRAEMALFRGAAGGLLSLAGLSIGVGQVIKLADTYQTLSTRVALATQYSGDFAKVQAALERSATDTRTPLESVLNLYSRISPSMAAIGKNGEDTARLIATVNKTMALSGATAQEKAAGLLQFGQALARGTLRGQELNSVLTETPALADAISRGLGVTRGELLKLGETGKLSALAVVEALEKSAAAVDRDFGKLPVSIGQAATVMGNTLLDVIGKLGESTGATQAFARALLMVSDGIKAFVADARPQLESIIRFVVDAVDGAARIFRIEGKGLAAWGAGGLAVLKGDFAQAAEIARDYADQVEQILLEPMGRDRERAKAIVADAQSLAEQRINLEKQLADKTTELENLRAYAAGKASKSILEDDRARVVEQIQNAKTLHTALQAAFEKTLADIAAANKEADALFAKARDLRQSGADKAQDRRDRANQGGLTPEQQDAIALRNYQDAAQTAAFSLATARVQALDGRVKEAKATTDQAVRDAQRAANLADKIKDDRAAASAIEEAANLQAQVVEAQAAAKKKDAANAQQVADAQAAMLRGLDQQLAELQAKANSLEVRVQTEQAAAAIEGLKKQIADLAAQAANVSFGANASGGPAQQAVAADVTRAGLQGFATGGPLPGVAPHDRADNMLYWGTPGEWVMQRPAVRYYGPQFMAALNAMRLPRFADGGLIGRLQLPAMPAAAGAGSSPTPVHLHLDGRSYAMSAADDVVARLTDHLGREALRKGAPR